MYTNALDRIEYGDKAAKRAQSEELEFDVPTPGVVVVTNLDSESAHSVNVDQGVPVSCSCPADTYQDEACKHRVACAMAEPVLGAASVESTGTRAMADGGTIAAPEPQGSADETTHAPGCENPECEGLDADAERPLLSGECWDEWAAYDEEELIEGAEKWEGRL